MRLTFLFIFIYIVTPHNATAQTKDIAGEYSLTGVMETASGIVLNKDSTFQFYFSYGALDRSGSGRWSVHDNNIILNSKPYPGYDFKIVKRLKTTDTFTTVKIEDLNLNLYQLVYCKANGAGGSMVYDADAKGLITLPNIADSIHILSELCPERITSFAADSRSNYYIINFEPWVREIFFNSFVLKYGVDHLYGRHPLLGEEQYTFKREK